jgi:hypothetical protein
MKKIYTLILASFIGITAHAQLTLTQAANAPMAGIYETSISFDSTTAIPKTTGTNKSWNFTSLVTGTSSATSFTYVNASTTPSASAFPGSTLSTSDGSTSHNYYTSTSTNLDLAGSADVGDVVHFTNPMTWMKWPFTFGTSNSDAFTGTETYSTTTINMTGQMNISGSGTGTVTMPMGHVYTNCLQILRTYTYNIGTPFNFTVTGRAYEYWSGLFRAPIITIDYSTLDDGSSLSPDASLTVNSLANVGIKEQELANNAFVVFPNPVKEKLNINLKDGSVAQEMKLFDVNGKMIISDLSTNTLNTSNLSKGVYILKVKANDVYSQKQIIISE